MDTDFLTITLTWLPMFFSLVLLLFSLILVLEENTHPLFLPACFYIGVWGVFIFIMMIVVIFEHKEHERDLELIKLINTP